MWKVSNPTRANNRGWEMGTACLMAMQLSYWEDATCYARYWQQLVHQVSGTPVCPSYLLYQSSKAWSANQMSFALKECLIPSQFPECAVWCAAAADTDPWWRDSARAVVKTAWSPVGTYPLPCLLKTLRKASSPSVCRGIHSVSCSISKCLLTLCIHNTFTMKPLYAFCPFTRLSLSPSGLIRTQIQRTSLV